MGAIDRANQFPRGINFNGEAFDGITAIDPSIVGFEAPVGSKLRSTVTGIFWRKIDLLDTDWAKSNSDPQGFEFNSMLVWNVNGSFQTGIEQDGIRFPQGSGVIERISVYAADRGGNGNIDIDIMKHDSGLVSAGVEFGIAGTTIYTTPANRPMIAGDNLNKTENALLWATAPDVLTFVAGTFYSMNIISVNNKNRDLSVIMFVRHN